MKVKIGDKIYDSNDVPILLILDEQDKENIGSMGGGTTKMMCYPEGMPKDEALALMQGNPIPSNISVDDIGFISKKFFYWWYNQSGANTEQGWRQWLASDEGKDILNKIRVNYGE